jgi:hypothetical protein
MKKQVENSKEFQLSCQCKKDQKNQGFCVGSTLLIVRLSILTILAILLNVADVEASHEMVTTVGCWDKNDAILITDTRADKGEGRGARVSENLIEQGFCEIFDYILEDVPNIVHLRKRDKNYFYQVLKTIAQYSGKDLYMLVDYETPLKSKLILKALTDFKPPGLTAWRFFN